MAQHYIEEADSLAALATKLNQSPVRVEIEYIEVSTRPMSSTYPDISVPVYRALIRRLDAGLMHG